MDFRWHSNGCCPPLNNGRPNGLIPPWHASKHWCLSYHHGRGIRPPALIPCQLPEWEHVSGQTWKNPSSGAIACIRPFQSIERTNRNEENKWITSVLLLIKLTIRVHLTRCLIIIVRHCVCCELSNVHVYKMKVKKLHEIQNSFSNWSTSAFQTYTLFSRNSEMYSKFSVNLPLLATMLWKHYKQLCDVCVYRDPRDKRWKYYWRKYFEKWTKSLLNRLDMQTCVPPMVCGHRCW